MRMRVGETLWRLIEVLYDRIDFLNMVEMNTFCFFLFSYFAALLNFVHSFFFFFLYIFC